MDGQNHREIIAAWDHDNNVEVKESTRQLKAPLEATQVSEYAEEIGRLHTEKVEYEKELKAKQTELKNAIQLRQDSIDSCIDSICNGTERAVDVKSWYNFTTGMVLEIALDTEEILDHRAMTDEDRQADMVLDDEEVDDDEPGEPSEDMDENTPLDDMIKEAIVAIKQTQRASTAMFQRRLKMSFTLASKLMDALEERGIVGPPNGDEPREILVDLDAEPEQEQEDETDE